MREGICSRKVVNSSLEILVAVLYTEYQNVGFLRSMSDCAWWQIVFSLSTLEAEVDDFL